MATTTGPAATPETQGQEKIAPRGLIQRFIFSKLDAFEKATGTSADYCRLMANVSPRAFFKYMKFANVAQYRRALPADASTVAHLVATQHEDCGPCVKIGVSFALRDGVSREILPRISQMNCAGLACDLRQNPLKIGVFGAFVPRRQENPMGDCQNGELRVDFDGRLKLRFVGSQVTTDAGLLAYGELDEALALTETGADILQDPRLGQNKQHGLVPLLRQSIYSRLAGYEDVNDAERLCVDPTM